MTIGDPDLGTVQVASGRSRGDQRDQLAVAQRARCSFLGSRAHATPRGDVTAAHAFNLRDPGASTVKG
jgi:hypothetical protein